jgi:hypothetical protein
MINQYFLYFIFIFIFYFLFKNFFIKKEHYSNQFYNKKCSNQNKPDDTERENCFKKALSKGTNIFTTCKTILIKENINNDDADDYCKKLIGLLNTECTLEDCLENTYQKIEDIDSFEEFKKEFKTNTDFANNIFKYKSEISNNYFKDYNLKLNDLEVLIQKFLSKKNNFNEKYSNLSDVQSVITDLLNNNNLSKNEDLKLFEIFNDYPFDEANQIMEKFKELDLINLLIQSYHQNEEDVLKDTIVKHTNDIDNKNKNLLKKLFYNNISEHDQSQLIHISNNPEFFLVKNKEENEENDTEIKENKPMKKIPNGDYKVTFDNSDNISKYGSNLKVIDNSLIFDNGLNFIYDIPRNIYINSVDNNKYIYYFNNNVIDEENIYINIFNVNNNDIENTDSLDNLETDNSVNNLNFDDNVIKKIDFNYPELVENFINNVEIKCSFADKRLVDIAAAYYYNQDESIIMNYVNEIYESNNNITDKNTLYECINSNIQKLVYDLIDTNENIFNELINKEVFIEDLKTCDFDTNYIDSLANLIQKNPNIDYSFRQKIITLNDSNFNYNGDKEDCIRNTILKYTNFLRDSKARNI